MKADLVNTSGEVADETNANSASSSERSRLLGGTVASSRVVYFLIFVVVLIAAFARPLWTLFTSALDNDLNSYIVLIPFVSLYFLYLERSKLARDYRSSAGWAVIPFVVGCVAIGSITSGIFHPGSENDRMAVTAFSFVCFLIAGAFAFLGRKWMASAAFPMLFLIFLVPLPDRWVDTMEMALRLASAEAANMFFALSRTPVLKTGTIFQLPGISLEVAQECSGIRSTWILFITSLVAAQLFLAKPMSRLALVISIVPLGILRNGFRILVIALLCIHVDQNMINSAIHRRGGPIFFALSLIPLLAILWVLRRRELNAAKRKTVSTPEP